MRARQRGSRGQVAARQVPGWPPATRASHAFGRPFVHAQANPMCAAAVIGVHRAGLDQVIAKPAFQQWEVHVAILDQRLQPKRMRRRPDGERAVRNV